MKRHVCLALVALACSACAAPGDGVPPREQRLQWFNEARFGMFVHWGIYSVIGMEASWPLYGHQYSREDYEAQARHFVPTQFDADELVGLAKRTGMKYLVITTKHHDGFCMFDSKLTDYTVAKGPLGRDLIREVVDACHRQGLRVGFYFSLCDWHDPRYRSLPVQGGNWPLEPIKEDPATWRSFVRYVHGQVRELLSNYGKIDIMWFDGGWEHTPEEWRSADLERTIRRLQPEILINDRLPGPGIADYVTPEQTIPASAPAGSWETCMTINNTWGYNPRDKAFKPAELLIRNLATTASGGGNFLLNVGPGPDGSVQPEFRERLEAIGDWLRRNGEAIYGTARGPRGVFTTGGATVRGNAMYLHLISAPEGAVELPAFEAKLKSVRTLTRGRPVPFSASAGGVRIDFDPAWFRPPVTVLRLEFDGPPKADTGTKPQPDGSFDLQAKSAEIHGTNLAYQPQYDDLGCWMNPSDWCRWEIKQERARTYRVTIAYGCPNDQAGSDVVLRVGGNDLRFVVEGTGAWTTYPERELGTVRLPAGVHAIELRCTRLAGFATLNLRCVKLVPVRRAGT